jgi:hypothetical protein
VTPSEFLAQVQSLGGEVYVKGDDLALRMRKGTLTDELRQLWAEVKLDLKVFVIKAWEAEERWQAYLAEHTVLSVCTRCAAQVQRWPWEDTATVLCLRCARLQLEDEDDPP